jgi:hypothetical protein
MSQPAENLQFHQDKFNILKPRPLEALGCIFISLLLFYVYNFQKISDGQNLYHLGSRLTAVNYLSTLSAKFGQNFSLMLSGRLGLIIFWAFIGSLTYTTYCIAIFFLTKMQDDIEEIKHRKWTKPLSHRVGRHLAFLFICIFFAGYCVTCFASLIPALTRTAYTAWFGSSLAFGITEFLFTIIAMSIIIYILLVMFKDIVSRWRWL